jgi:hypothetical protein
MIAETAIDLLEGHRIVANAPEILKNAIEKCARMLTGKVTEFIELVGGELLPKWQRRRIPKRRRERLEAIVLTAQALVKHVDLLSLRVGAPRGAAPASDAEDVRYVNPPGQAKLCEETGLSITRLRRAIKDLRLAGYILGPAKGKKENRQRRIEYTRPDGTKGWSSCRVVYVLTRKFFERLELSKRLEKEQADAYQRARAGRPSSGALLAAREHRRGWKAGSRETRPLGSPGTPTRAVAGTTGQTDPPPTEERARQLMAIQLAIRGAHPEWDPDRVRAEALERLKRS